MSFVLVIPARAASTRLPNKPLLDVVGLPLVVRTAQQVARAGAAQLLVATDDETIAAVVEKHGFSAMLTGATHNSGTDRLSEVVERLSLADETIVVNVQGDEPLIDPEIVKLLADQLSDSSQAAIATCATAITSAEQFFDPNCVKVVCDHHQNALFFSRAPIPWARDYLNSHPKQLAPQLPALRHIGLYAYRAKFLRQFPKLPRGQLENFESLEQLRALENGFKISVKVLASAPEPGVDTPADLARVRKIYSNRL